MANLDEVVAQMTEAELAADYEAYEAYCAKVWNAQDRTRAQYIPIPHPADEI